MLTYPQYAALLASDSSQTRTKCWFRKKSNILVVNKLRFSRPFAKQAPLTLDLKQNVGYENGFLFTEFFAEDLVCHYLSR